MRKNPAYHEQTQSDDANDILSKEENNKPETSAAGAVTGTDPSMPVDDFLDKTIILTTDIDLGGKQRRLSLKTQRKLRIRRKDLIHNRVHSCR